MSASALDVSYLSPTALPENIAIALSAAEQLGVPQLLDADDLSAGDLDYRSLHLYLSYFTTEQVRLHTDCTADATCPCSGTD